MIVFICVFLRIFSYTYGCAPTTPVVTTTISPNVTTTAASSTTITTSPSNATTTTVQSTTVNNCCVWPFLGTGVNTVTPLQDSWNGCDQSVSFWCAYSNSTVLQPIAFAINFPNDTTVLDGPTQTFSPQTIANLTATITCNTSNNLWAINNSTSRFYKIACAYRSGNEWVVGT